MGKHLSDVTKGRKLLPVTAGDLDIVTHAIHLHRNYDAVVGRLLAIDESAFEITQHIDRSRVRIEWVDDAEFWGILNTLHEFGLLKVRGKDGSESSKITSGRFTNY